MFCQVIISKPHQQFFHKHAIGDCDDDTMSFKKKSVRADINNFPSFFTSELSCAASLVTKTQWKLCTTCLVSTVC